MPHPALMHHHIILPGQISISAFGTRYKHCLIHRERSLSVINANINESIVEHFSVFRIRPCGTIFSNVDFSRCRLSASNVKFPQMYLRDLVFDTVNGLLWYVLISNSAEKATSSGKVLS